MGISGSQVIGAIAIGLGASLLMDVWNLFLKRAFGIPSLNYCLLGRWLLHMPGGVFRHTGIAAAAGKPLECPVGWVAHYSIGAALALSFVLAGPSDWMIRPTPGPALLFGVATVVFPFFVMQPAFGLGMAGSRTPNPLQARAKSLATHTVFGAGLYVCALLLTLV